MDSILNYTLEDLEKVMLEMNEKKFKALQIFKWIYQKKVFDFDKMSDIKKSFIEELKSRFIINPLEEISRQVSSDGTVKFLFKLDDHEVIETVLMRFDYGNSICVTTQVGCNMGCKFCASGLLKRVRNLKTSEIVGQLLKASEYLLPENGRVDNIVVMGIGEPFDNYDNMIKFCKIANNSNGLAIGARHITVSTCGMIEGIKKFANEKEQFNLAISLHAPNDKIRSDIMPINKAYNLQTLFNALKYYSDHSNRRITYEYIMLNDVNDSKEDALELARLVKGKNAYINLIGYNQVDENGYTGSSNKKILNFYDVLMKNNVKATIRNKVGDDIDAACGQLRAKHKGIL